MEEEYCIYKLIDGKKFTISLNNNINKIIIKFNEIRSTSSNFNFVKSQNIVDLYEISENENKNMVLSGNFGEFKFSNDGLCLGFQPATFSC